MALSDIQFPADDILSALGKGGIGESGVQFMDIGVMPCILNRMKRQWFLDYVLGDLVCLLPYVDATDDALEISIAPAKFDFMGAVVAYAGQNNVTLTDNATNYVYLLYAAGAWAATANTTSWPSYALPHIRICTVTTASGVYAYSDIALYRQTSLLNIAGASDASPHTVYNGTGVQIDPGQLLHVCGWNAANACYVVELADADTANKPAQLVASGTIANSTTGLATTQYDLGSLNTSAGSVGDDVYLSDTAGGWTLTAPSGADQIDQVVGKITVADAAAGVIRFQVGLAGQPEQIGTSGIADDAVIAEKLASTVQNMIPYLTVTGADDGDGTGSATIQIKDAAGNNLAQRFRVTTWIAETDYDTVPDAQTDFSVTTGTQKTEVTADAEYVVDTDATGLAVMNIDAGGAKTVYVMAEVNGRVYSSGAINITAP